MADPRSYSPRDVARLFNVHTRTVYRWGTIGKLRYFKTPGGERRYYADDIDRMIRNGHQPHE